MFCVKIFNINKTEPNMPFELNETEKQQFEEIKGNPNLLTYKLDSNGEAFLPYNANVVCALLEDADFVSKNGNKVAKYIKDATEGFSYEKKVGSHTETIEVDDVDVIGGHQHIYGKRKEENTVADYKETQVKPAFTAGDIEQVKKSYDKANEAIGRNGDFSIRPFGLPQDKSPLQWALDNDHKKYAANYVNYYCNTDDFQNKFHALDDKQKNALLEDASLNAVCALGSKEQIEKRVAKSETLIPSLAAAEQAVAKDCDLDTLEKMQAALVSKNSSKKLDNTIAVKQAKSLAYDDPVMQIVNAKPGEVNKATDDYIEHVEAREKQISPNEFEREMARDFAVLHENNKPQPDFMQMAKKLTEDIKNPDWKDKLRDIIANSSIGKRLGVHSSRATKIAKSLKSRAQHQKVELPPSKGANKGQGR